MLISNFMNRTNLNFTEAIAVTFCWPWCLEYICLMASKLNFESWLWNPKFGLCLEPHLWSQMVGDLLVWHYIFLPSPKWCYICLRGSRAPTPKKSQSYFHIAIILLSERCHHHRYCKFVWQSIYWKKEDLIEINCFCFFETCRIWVLLSWAK